jgi:5-methylcytosine-specific restriction endonuclease McrA
MAWQCDHIVAVVNGGENRERNLQTLCGPCHGFKTKADVSEKAKVYAVKAKHLGVKKSSRPMPGSKASGIRKRMSGAVERW